MENIKKFHILDIIRIPLCLLVICQHLKWAYEENLECLYWCATTGFFTISGFLMCNKNESSYRRGIHKMVKLSVISTILYLPIYLWVGKFKDYRNLTDWLNFVVFNQSIILEPLWYLTAYLYVLIIFFYLGKYRENKFLLITLFLTLALAKVYLWSKDYEIMYYRNWLFEGIPYYSLGILMRLKYNSSNFHFFESKNTSVIKIANFGSKYTLPIYILHPMIIILSGYTLCFFFIFRAAVWWLGPIIFFILSTIVWYGFIVLKKLCIDCFR